MQSSPDATVTHRESLAAWNALLDSTSVATLRSVQSLAKEACGEISDIFYATMMQQERARAFLTHDVVNQRLREAMRRWLLHVFDTVTRDALASTVAHLVEVGEIHARIKLPPELMTTGIRVLKAELLRRIMQRVTSPDERLAAVMYIDDVIHIADGLMNTAYIRNIQDNVRNDEAYRALALKHDTALERERQRATLSDWAQKFLFSVQRRTRRSPVLPLGKSEFALWMKHKARVLFEGMTDTEMVFDVIDHVDTVLVPQLAAEDVAPDKFDRLIEDLERQVEFIRYLVGDLFDRLGQSEQGRDTVTRMLNRRYLISILARELEEHRRASQPFCVLMIRPDALEVRTSDGDSRNLLLQQVALTLQTSVRSGDHAFRYSENEFLVIAVENSADDATWTATQIRNNVRAQSIMLTGGTSGAVTLSIGLACFDGHPDYQYLLDRSRSALELAMMNGGNRIEVL